MRGAKTQGGAFIPAGGVHSVHREEEVGHEGPQAIINVKNEGWVLLGRTGPVACVIFGISSLLHSWHLMELWQRVGEPLMYEDS